MKLRALLWFGAGLLAVICGWTTVNLWGLGGAMFIVEPPAELLQRHLLSIATYTVVAFLGGWLAERGWRKHMARAVPGLIGMLVGLLSALPLILASRGWEEGVWDSSSMPFGALRSIAQIFVLAFGGWEFVELANASGAGMLGGMLAARRRS